MSREDWSTRGVAAGGQRLFSPEEVETLVAIKQLRQLGYYPLEHIKELLSLPGRQSSSPGRAGFAWKRSLSLAEHAEPGDARQHFQKPRELHRRVKGTGPRERR